MRYIIPILLLINSFTYSQHKIVWFPSKLNIQPFTANIIEPKAGALFSLDQNKIRLDIGTSQDIVNLDYSNFSISFGADLFTYTRLRSAESFKFPVETIDYLFGINACYKRLLKDNEIGFRFRLSHVSAHLVDGQYDHQNAQWRNGRTPFIFSKEFLEFFPYYRKNSFRVYGGFTYIFHIIPSEIKKDIYQIGFDYYILPISTELITPYIAYDFKLNGIHSNFFGNNIFTSGLKFGNWNEKGFSIHFTYISGKSLHGQYFDKSENYASVGFNFDL